MLCRRQLSAAISAAVWQAAIIVRQELAVQGEFTPTACSETGAKQWPEKEFLNPLKDPLPDAPNMKIFCMYGVGAPAERSYHYQHVDDPMVCPRSLPACILIATFCVAENSPHMPCL